MYGMTPEKLEQTLRGLIVKLHTVCPGSIGDLMEFQFVSCSDDGTCITMACKTLEWMRNGPGTLHGGIWATVVDQAMGYVACCFRPNDSATPTVHLDVDYHRPLAPGEEVLVQVTVEGVGRTLMHMSAKAYNLHVPDKLCVSASSIYFFKRAPE